MNFFVFNNWIRCRKTNLVVCILLPGRARDQEQGGREELLTKKAKPTPVMLANLKGSKKDRKIKYDWRILLDSGCLDSIALKNMEEKWRRN